MSTPRKYYDEFKGRFEKMSNAELMDALKGQAGNPGWVSARASYLAALRDEFKRRGYDYSAFRRVTANIAGRFSPERLAALRYSYDPPTSEMADLLHERFLLAHEGTFSVFLRAVRRGIILGHSAYIRWLDAGAESNATCSRAIPK